MFRLMFLQAALVSCTFGLAACGAGSSGGDGTSPAPDQPSTEVVPVEQPEAPETVEVPETVEDNDSPAVPETPEVSTEPDHEHEHEDGSDVVVVIPPVVETPSAVSGLIRLTNQWSGGYGAELVLTNHQLSPITGWKLTCASRLQISSLWNADYTQTAGFLEVTPKSWSREMPVGQSITIGFQGAGGIAEGDLSGCDLSGLALEIAFTDTSTAEDNEPVANEDDDEITVDPIPDASGGEVALSTLQQTEAQLTSGNLMQQVKHSIATRDNAIVEAVMPLASSNPENVQRVEWILSEADWDYLFPRRAEEYTYRKFLQAIAKFPAFCGDYDDGRDADAICRKALATMFAHFTQETGGHTIAWEEPQWRQGLHYIRELGWSEAMANGYGICDSTTWQAQSWPCGVFPAGHVNAGQSKSYFGRGAKQLSYNYNYGPFSLAMYGDVGVLLEHPEWVADTWLNLASAVFFYVYPQPPKPSMLHVVDGTWQPNAQDRSAGLVLGFGVTTQIINGGIECGGNAEHQQSRNRIDYYQNMAAFLQVPVADDEVLGCAGMQQFESGGAGALAIYWEQSWTQDNACQLVGYQTPFSAFTEGDYVKCVQHHFDVTVDVTR